MWCSLKFQAEIITAVWLRRSTTEAIFIFLLTIYTVLQARGKQLRVGPAKIGWTVEGASKLGGSGGMLPREILKFSSSKMHIWRIRRENKRKNEPKLMVKVVCVLMQQIDIYFSTVMDIFK